MGTGPITTQINQGIHHSGFMGGNQLPHAMQVGGGVKSHQWRGGIGDAMKTLQDLSSGIFHPTRIA